MQIKKIANIGAVVAKVIDNLNSTSNIDTPSCRAVKEVLDLRGSCGVFYRNDTPQNIPAYTATTVAFNNTRYVDNDCFALQADGTIKILKDISRVLVTFNIRFNEGGFNIVYANTSTSGGGGFNASSLNDDMVCGSGILKVQKDGIINISTYKGVAGSVIGYDEHWVGMCITVLK